MCGKSLTYRHPSWLYLDIGKSIMLVSEQKYTQYCGNLSTPLQMSKRGHCAESNMQCIVILRCPSSVHLNNDKIWLLDCNARVPTRWPQTADTLYSHGQWLIHGHPGERTPQRGTNVAHASAQSAVEHCMRQMKSGLYCLQRYRTLHNQPDCAATITAACAALNIALLLEQP